MTKNILEVLSRRPSRRSEIQRVSLVDPLRRFNGSDFAQFKLFNTLAKAIATQTSIMVESLLGDEAILDWKKVGDYATTHQIADLSILCSDCLVQFTIKDLKLDGALPPLNAGLIVDILSLVRLMYGDFATGDTFGLLTFEESLESRDVNDPQDIRYLTRLLDQLMNIPQSPKNPQREAKIHKLRTLFSEHRRAFSYTLHSVL